MEHGYRKNNKWSMKMEGWLGSEKVVQENALATGTTSTAVIPTREMAGSLLAGTRKGNALSDVILLSEEQEASLVFWEETVFWVTFAETPRLRLFL